MTWSLALKNGDLSLNSSSGFDTVTNEDKLVQDLRCHLLEKMGNDELNLEFGSLINGGIKPDGTLHNGFIGEANDDVTVLNIQSEITRVVSNYQARTLNRAKSDKMTYGKASLTHGEVLFNLNNIKIDSYFDQINILISFTSAANNTLTLDLTL